MDWINEAKRIFRMQKPEHFTDYKHCYECEQHDQTLINGSIDAIGLNELGNVGWDPMCFATAEGLKYYLPSLVRLSLESIDSEFYFGQFLFHLGYSEANGKGNRLYLACNQEQRHYIGQFVEYVSVQYKEQLQENLFEEDAVTVKELWAIT